MTSTALFFWFRIALIVLLAGWLTYRIYRRRNTLIDFDKVERQDEILAERRARQEQMVDRATGGRTRTLTEPVVSDLSEAKRSTEPGASPRSMGSQPRVNQERGAGQQAASPQPLASETLTELNGEGASEAPSHLPHRHVNDSVAREPRAPARRETSKQARDDAPSVAEQILSELSAPPSRPSVFDGGLIEEPVETGMTRLLFRCRERSWITVNINGSLKRSLDNGRELEVLAEQGTLEILIDDREHGSTVQLRLQAWSPRYTVYLEAGEVVACEDPLGPVEGLEIRVLKQASDVSGAAPDSSGTMLVFESEQDAWLNITVEGADPLILMGERFGFMEITSGTHTIEIEDRMGGHRSRIRVNAWSARCTIYLEDGYVVRCEDEMGRLDIEWC